MSSIFYIVLSVAAMFFGVYLYTFLGEFLRNRKHRMTKKIGKIKDLGAHKS
jgi:hypothetical protein